uniref:Protein quiver n=1 Tax=Steinernema glaseri TaxID=37863 RepID=A0A1I8AUP3_9BILA
MTVASLLSLSLVLFISKTVASTNCYHCTSQLKTNGDDSSRTTMRVFLNEMYNVPPASPLCGDSSDLEFPSLPTTQCGKGRCIKLTMVSGGGQSTCDRL